MSFHRLLIMVLLLAPAGSARAIDRDQVMARARAFANHPWRCTAANLTASCSTTYKSEHIPGDYIGLPYDWGGYMTLFEFDQQIAQGLGAGSFPSDGVLDCTAGLDCSGYVSKCWDETHLTTKSIPDVSSVIAQSALLPGDVLNLSGTHVVIYSHSLASGEPVFYESGGYNVHLNTYGGWSHAAGYTPRRYNQIQGTGAGDPPGTTTNPIVIGSLPYSDSGNTELSVSDVLDGCGAVPTTSEAGPEVIYKVTLTQPGDLTVSVSDGPGVDIDVHLYTSMNTSDCIARHDQTLTHPVDCGTYYIVADTYSSSDVDYAGPYTLTASFTPSGAPCGSGPPAYTPKGKLGDTCKYQDNQNLPFCNPILGGVICIYSSTTSFCSKPCTTNADCAEFSGGCCKDVSGQGEYYCLLSSFCGWASADLGVPDSQVGDAMPADGPATLDGSTMPDVGTADAGAADSGAADSGAADGGQPQDDEEGGCACEIHRPPPRAPVAGWLLLIGVLLLGVTRRR
jgi:MYXO-CTERM domain-containing protein